MKEFENVEEKNLEIPLLDFYMLIIYSGVFELLAFIFVVGILCSLKHEFSIYKKKTKNTFVYTKMKIILSHMKS